MPHGRPGTRLQTLYPIVVFGVVLFYIGTAILIFLYTLMIRLVPVKIPTSDVSPDRIKHGRP